VKIVAQRLNIPEEDVVDTAETAEEVLQRQRDFLSTLFNVVSEKLESHTIDNSTVPLPILCLSHGGFIRAFLNQLSAFGEFSESLPDIGKIANCSVSIVNFNWSSIDDFISNSDNVKIHLDELMRNFDGHISG
jgi:broad specificity phosphatase PhoE